MSEDLKSVQARIPVLGPTEEGDTQIFSAPGDTLIANVVYTPAGDIRGDWDRPRYMQLRVGRLDEPGGRYVADASAQQSAFYLPAGVPQNVELVWTNRLRVREGETLYWSSHVLRSHQAGGIPDPGGTVQFFSNTRTWANPPPRGWSLHIGGAGRWASPTGSAKFPPEGVPCTWRIM
jgi:hypothetical protein